MSVVADLDGPYQDLVSRTSQLRGIMTIIEALSRQPQNAPQSHRDNVDLSVLGGATSNTTNAMCIVFLASSFEEFFREVVAQCGGELAECYSAVPADIKLVARGSYWEACLDGLRFNRRIVGGKPKAINSDALAKARYLVDSARSFALTDDAAGIDGKIFGQHSRNFRPVVVEEIAARLGVTGVMRRASDSNRLRAYFGETTMAAVEPKLRAKLDGFYQTRNEIVHSLSASTGFGVDYVIDQIELIEAFSESLRNLFQKHIRSWVPAS